MLTAIETPEIIQIPYAGIAPAFPVITFDLPNNQPFELTYIRTTVTSAPAAIAIPLFIVRDENAALVLNIGVIPWQSAATTVSTTTMQTPDIPITALFGPAISGFIVSEFHVFDGWTIEASEFVGTPGVIFDAIITLTK